ARDVFFESLLRAVFAATFVNALPIHRRATSGHALGDFRARLLSDPCVFILFPEGTRTRDGKMNRFKPGIGMLVAGSDVPVGPCRTDGAYRATPPTRWLLRPSRMTIRLGPAQKFPELPNGREGWDECARRLEAAVRALDPHGQGGGVESSGR